MARPHWSPGDRVFARLNGVDEPATVRGGWVTEHLDARGVPSRTPDETYIVTLDSAPNELTRIDGATIQGAAT